MIEAQYSWRDRDPNAVIGWMPRVFWWMSFFIDEDPQMKVEAAYLQAQIQVQKEDAHAEALKESEQHGLV